MQVFIHDPLYRMAMSATAAKHRQLQEADDVNAAFNEHAIAPLGNADAERTLLRVRQKLEGREGGEFRALPTYSSLMLAISIDVTWFPCCAVHAAYDVEICCGRGQAAYVQSKRSEPHMIILVLDIIRGNILTDLPWSMCSMDS